MTELKNEQEILENHYNEWVKKQDKIIINLWEELNYLRYRPQKKGKQEKQLQLDRPVFVSSKPERLKTCMGIEITLVFRSSACSWTKSKAGGCTMCGYWNDRAPPEITETNLWNQFQVALAKFKTELESESNKIVFKMFTSGSYCDPKEFSIPLQLKILKELCKYSSIQEIVVESRPEYITENLMTEYRQIITDQYFEIGVGLETADDYIRTNIINKGFLWKNFLDSLTILHKYDFGMKAYLLFKPPFVNEYTAMLDTYDSIRKCIVNKVDTISVNPTNIQQNTICDELQKAKAFRPPWLFSLLILLKNSITNEEMKNTRIICDPSAAGKDRGVHNCHPKDPSNFECLDILHKFVETQNIDSIPEQFEGRCWEEYEFISLLEK